MGPSNFQERTQKNWYTLKLMSPLKRMSHLKSKYIIKRRQVEVRERTLSPEEAIQFTKAKHTEVRNVIAAECF